MDDSRFYDLFNSISYQHDERLIMKGVCNGAPFTVEKMLYKDSVCSNWSKYFPFKAGGAEMGTA